MHVGCKEKTGGCRLPRNAFRLEVVAAVLGDAEAPKGLAKSVDAVPLGADDDNNGMHPAHCRSLHDRRMARHHL